MLRGHVKVRVAQIAASNFAAGITVVEFEVGYHHNYYEFSRNKNSWRISDPKPTFIAMTANSCRECNMEFASLRLVSGHKKSISTKVMKVSSVVEDDETLSNLRNFCMILRKTDSLTKFSGVVNPLFFNVVASHGDASKQGEPEDVARCLMILVRSVVSSLKFNSGVEDYDNSVYFGNVIAFCGSKIFCGNDGDFVPHAWLKYYDSGDPIALPTFLDGEIYESVWEGSLSTLGDDLDERACCHSIGLLYAVLLHEVLVHDLDKIRHTVILGDGGNLEEEGSRIAVAADSCVEVHTISSEFEWVVLNIVDAAARDSRYVLHWFQAPATKSTSLDAGNQLQRKCTWPVVIYVLLQCRALAHGVISLIVSYIFVVSTLRTRRLLSGRELIGTSSLKSNRPTKPGPDIFYC